MADSFALPPIVSRPLSSSARSAEAPARYNSDSSLVQQMGLLERENGILTQQMRQLEGVVAILVKKNEDAQSSQASIDLELRMQGRSGDLLSADVDRRLSLMEKHVSQENNLLVKLHEKVLKLDSPENQRASQESLVVQQMRTVERMKEEAVARGTSFDDEVAGLRRSLAQQKNEGDDWQIREKRKGAVLYSEIVRMGEQMQESQRLSTNQYVQMEQRLKDLEQRNFTNEQMLLQFDTREASHFADGGQNVQDMAAKMQYLSQEVARLQARSNIELTERKETSSQQHEWVQQLQSALQQTDINFGERLTGALQQLMNSIAEDRSAMAVRWEEEQQKMLQRDSARSAKESEARELISERFAALEKKVYEESTEREQDQQTHDRREQQQWHQLSIQIEEEVSTRQMEKEQFSHLLRSSLSKLQSTTEQQIDSVQRQFNSLEEVVRAAVRARLVAEQKAKEKAETVNAVLGNAVEVVQAESRAARNKLSAQIMSTSHAQAEALVVAVKERQYAMEAQAKAQTFIDSEHRAQLNEVEEQLNASHTARIASEKQIHSEIHQSVKSLQSSIAAFESRLSASENATEIALDGMKSGAEQGLTELASALQQVMQLWSSDAQAEIVSLRQETATALNNIRQSISITDKHTSTVVKDLGDAVEESLVEQEVGRVLQVMVNLVADEVQNDLISEVQDEIKEETQSRISLDERVQYDAVVSNAAHHAMQVASVMEEMIFRIEHYEVQERIVQMEDNCSRTANDISREAEKRINLQADVQQSQRVVLEMQLELDVAAAMEHLIVSVVQQSTLDVVTDLRNEQESARIRTNCGFETLRSQFQAERTQNEDFRTRNEMQLSAIQDIRDSNKLVWDSCLALARSDEAATSIDLPAPEYDLLTVADGVFDRK